MRPISFVFALLALGCATSTSVMPPESPSNLTGDQLAQARSALALGDSVMQIQGDPTQYVGSALVEVHTGDHPSVQLTVIGAPVDARVNAIGGTFVIPDQYAHDLSSSGWSFTMSSADPEQPIGMTGIPIHARLDQMQMTADPQGLFFATLYLTNTDDGAARIVTITGRLTGGCDVNVGGAVTAVGNPSSVVGCASVIGQL